MKSAAEAVPLRNTGDDATFPEKPKPRGLLGAFRYRTMFAKHFYDRPVFLVVKHL